jgi:ElaB/YqjD/DUF883 family membrane-anchored ribosome-binding protein
LQQEDRMGTRTSNDRFKRGSWHSDGSAPLDLDLPPSPQTTHQASASTSAPPAGDLSRQFNQMAHTLVDSGKARIDDATSMVKHKMSSSLDSLSSRIRERPFMAVGGALLLGILIGRAR